VCIESIPPEEVLISRNARDLESASYVAHRMIKSVSDLVAMGYDQDAVDPEAYDEIEARNPFDNMVYPDRNDTGAKEVLYVEHYLFYDFDGDGIDERIRVCTAGEGVNVLNVEQWDDLPIAMFCPDPEPHTAIGSCPADYLKPIQAAKSQIMRDTLVWLLLKVKSILTMYSIQILDSPFEFAPLGWFNPLQYPSLVKRLSLFLDTSMKQKRIGLVCLKPLLA